MQWISENASFMLNGNLVNSPTHVQSNFWFEQVLNDNCELMQVEWSENNEYFAKTPFSLQIQNWFT